MLAIFLVGMVSLPASAQDQCDNQKKIFRAIQNSDMDTLSRLIIAGADMNRANDHGFTPLMEAARNGDQHVLAFILSHGPDVNAQNKAGGTALMIAAKYGHKRAAEQLLAHGADPMIINNFGNKASDFASAYQQESVYNILQRAEREFGKL